MRPCRKTVCQTFLENYFLFIKSLIRMFEDKKKTMIAVTLLSNKERRKPGRSGDKLLLRERGGDWTELESISLPS